MSRSGVLVISGRVRPLVDCAERGRAFDRSRAAAGDFRTAETIRTKLDQVNSAMAQFVGDVARSTAPEDWRAPFALFLGTWANFYAAARSSWWSQQWGDTYTQAERFETRLADWQADFSRKRYGAITGPLVRPEAGERERMTEGLATGLKVLGVAIIVAGGAYVVAQVAR